MEQHRGRIGVASSPGQGTTFLLDFPLISMRAESVGTVKVIPDMDGTETILVAEDEETIRSVVRTILEGFGYPVIEAVDGEDALQRFRELKDAVDLVLLDVVMPRKDGRWARDEIRRLRPDMKFFFMSGYAPGYLDEKGISEEQSWLLWKPFTPSRLAETVRRKLDG